MLLVSVLVRAAAGCSDTPLPDPGVEITNAEGPTWTPESAWRLEEDLRLGSAGGGSREEEQFGEIQSVGSDSQGRIYVLDWLSQDIRVFDRNSSFSHRIGRRGSGPGEFGAARAFVSGPGDSLWVLDDGTLRYSVFAPNGSFVRSHRRTTVGYFPSLRGTVLADGSYLDWEMASPEGRFGARFLFYPIRFRPGSDRSPDSFLALEHRWHLLPSGMPEAHFGEHLIGAVDRKGSIWFSRSREYRIYRRSLEGDTTLVFGLPATPARTGTAERDFIRKAYAHIPGLVSEYLDALPATRPIVHHLVPDNAGHLLVFADIAGEPPGTVVDVFRDTGVYLGRLTLPTAVALGPPRSPPIVHVNQEYLLAVVRDELDVPYVSRLKIVKER